MMRGAKPTKDFVPCQRQNGSHLDQIRTYIWNSESIDVVHEIGGAGQKLSTCPCREINHHSVYSE